MADNLIILKNSSYAKGRKYIVDAEQLNTNFRIVLDSVGATSVKTVIESTGQIYNPLSSEQLLNAIVQLILSANYFKDIGEVNNLILESYTDGYGIPTKYVDKMSVRFTPKYLNTGSTTISFNGLSGVPLLTDSESELESGSLIPGNDYYAVYSSSKNSFILSSTIEDSGSLALEEIKRLIESAGLVFSQVFYSQLEQAVALYSLQHSYNCVSTQRDITLNNYLLEPIDNFAQLPKYVNGVCIRFRPSFSNTLVNPTIQIGGLQKVQLVMSNGDSIPEGSINQSYDIVVKYEDGVFYLVSNNYSSLKLQSSSVVTSISNSVSLEGNSQTAIPTEFAVKSYVDSQLNSNKKYAVASGKKTSTGKSDFFKKESNTVLSVLAGVVGEPSYTSVVSLSNAEASENADPTIEPGEEGEEPTVTTYTLSNCFDGNNDTYYQTKATAVSENPVAGIRNAEADWGYIVMPNYIGATNISESISRFRILGNQNNTLPSTVFFQYSIDNGVTWQNVGTQIYQEVQSTGAVVNKVIPTEFAVPFTSGEYSNINVNIIPYIDAADHDLGTSYPFNVRCYANEYSNKDLGWQVVSYEFCVTSDEIEPLVLTYPDGSTEIVTTVNTLSLDGITGNKATVIKVKNGQFLLEDTGYYFESASEPLGKKDGVYWAKITNSGVETYVYEEDEETQDLNKKSIQFVKVGSIDINNGEISVLHPSAFNGEFYSINMDLSESVEIEHNIGSINTAKMYITCINPEGGYDEGDTVDIVTQSISIDTSKLNVSTSIGNTNLEFDTISIGGVEYEVNCTTNPHNHTASSSVSTNGQLTSYRLVTSGYSKALLKYDLLTIPNKENGEFFTVSPSNWKLNVICSRSF